MVKHRHYDDAEFVYFYKNSKGKWMKRRVIGSTQAMAEFLGIIHQTYPDKTISQLREILTDKTKYICSPDAIKILDAHIAIGRGDVIPNWTYPLHCYYKPKTEEERLKDMSNRHHRKRRRRTNTAGDCNE